VGSALLCAQLLHRLDFLYEIESSQEGVARDEINKVNAELQAIADAIKEQKYEQK
jgi:hypothetical protein